MGLRKSKQGKQIRWLVFPLSTAFVGFLLSQIFASSPFNPSILQTVKLSTFFLYSPNIQFFIVAYILAIYKFVLSLMVGHTKPIMQKYSSQIIVAIQPINFTTVKHLYFFVQTDHSKFYTSRRIEPPYFFVQTDHHSLTHRAVSSHHIFLYRLIIIASHIAPYQATIFFCID